MHQKLFGGPHVAFIILSPTTIYRLDGQHTSQRVVALLRFGYSGFYAKLSLVSHTYNVCGSNVSVRLKVCGRYINGFLNGL